MSDSSSRTAWEWVQGRDEAVHLCGHRLSIAFGAAMCEARHTRSEPVLPDLDEIITETLDQHTIGQWSDLTFANFRRSSLAKACALADWQSQVGNGHLVGAYAAAKAHWIESVVLDEEPNFADLELPAAAIPWTVTASQFMVFQTPAGADVGEDAVGEVEAVFGPLEMEELIVGLLVATMGEQVADLWVAPLYPDQVDPETGDPLDGWNGVGVRASAFLEDVLIEGAGVDYVE